MSDGEIAGLMAEEMARDACETVKADCKASVKLSCARS